MGYRQIYANGAIYPYSKGNWSSSNSTSSNWRGKNKNKIKNKTKGKEILAFLFIFPHSFKQNVKLYLITSMLACLHESVVQTSYVISHVPSYFRKGNLLGVLLGAKIVPESKS